MKEKKNTKHIFLELDIKLLPSHHFLDHILRLHWKKLVHQTIQNNKGHRNNCNCVYNYLKNKIKRGASMQLQKVAPILIRS